MTSAERDEMKKVQIELISRRYFTIQLSVTRILANDIVAGGETYVSLFETKNGAYALCESEQTLTLQDIMDITSSMGLSVLGYLAPFGDMDYFTNYGKKAYDSVFPAHGTITDADTAYYQKLSPYNPALVRIRRQNGEIRRYNPIAKKWLREFDVKFSDIHQKHPRKVQ